MMQSRTPAETFALVLGALLTVIGVAGFFVNSDFSTGNAITAGALVVFDVNGWMNLVHLVTGLAGIWVAMRPGHARQYALVVGVAYVAIAVWGLLTATVLGLLPVNGADTVLHAGIGALALMVGLGPDRAES
jgi:hypothetical protein